MDLYDTVYFLGVNKYLEKKASAASVAVKHVSEPLWHNIAEIGGLGILAAPNISSLLGYKWKEKPKDIAEVTGLGILAAPSVHNIIKGIKK